ncbi:MAG: T9SS type A sorting domain-containing protein [Bacteroidia bacterium]|nr:T9SS type A sorting domain-containing protein [Bacteroidia bacterium]
MKNFIKGLAILLVSNIAFAQSPTLDKDFKNRSELSSAGSSFNNDQFTVNWTLGNTLYSLSEGNSETISTELKALSAGIKAYPNPTKDNLVIITDTDLEEPLFVHVFDLSKKRLLVEPMTDKEVRIGLTDLPSALYIIKILNGKDQLIKTFKIIKN